MAPRDQGLECIELLGGKLPGDESQPYTKKGVVKARA